MVRHLDDLLADAKNLNCTYKWMNHIISPEERRRWLSGSAGVPRQRQVLRATEVPNHCEIFHVIEEFSTASRTGRRRDECGDDRATSARTTRSG